jgi:stress responsive alpha/beta barrel protein
MLNSVVKAALVVLLAGPLAFPVMAFASQNQKKQVRHIVVFKYKAGTTPEQIAEVTNAFRALAKTIPGITGFEDGVNNSPEKRNLGFTHVYMVTFEDATARDAYLPHPEHKKFGQLLGKLGVVEDVFVVDF